MSFRSSSFGGYADTDCGGTLKASGGSVSHGSEMLVIDMMAGKGNSNVSADGVCPTIATTHGDMHAVCFQQNQREEVRLVDGKGDVCGALNAESGTHQQNYVCGFLPAQGRKARGIGFGENVSPTLRAEQQVGVLCYENHPQDSRVKESDVVQTLDRRMGTGGGNGPLVQSVVTNSNGGATPPLTCRDLVAQVNAENDKSGGYVLQSYLVDSTSSNSWKCANPHSGVHRTDSAVTLTTQTPNLECHQGGLIIHHAMSVHGTMDSCVSAVSFCSFVRRLMPVECERLMGFPDGWTQIPWKGRPAEQCPDAPRYKACGNSMCVNVMRWIGERIEEFSKKEN